MIGWSAIAETALGHEELAIADENAKIAAALRAPEAAKNADVLFLVANGHSETATWLYDLGRIADAIQANRGAMAELAALRALDLGNLRVQSEQANVHATMCDLLLSQGNRDGARSEYAAAQDLLAGLMAEPMPKRQWRIHTSGRLAVLRARLATTQSEVAAAEQGLAAYLADVAKYEHEGNEFSARDLTVIASADLMQGDLSMAHGRVDEANSAWRSAATRLRPQAEHLNPAAMTLLAQADFRLGGTQDARAWADRVMGTSYRHPVFADLLKQLGPAQKTGETPTS